MSELKYTPKKTQELIDMLCYAGCAKGEEQSMLEAVDEAFMNETQDMRAKLQETEEKLLAARCTIHSAYLQGKSGQEMETMDIECIREYSVSEVFKIVAEYESKETKLKIAQEALELAFSELGDAHPMCEEAVTARNTIGEALAQLKENKD